jgi:hypothetical protein
MALLRVYAHHHAPPAAFGTQSSVSSGALPAPIAIYWAELAPQATVNAEGFGPPAVLGPVFASGTPMGNYAKPVDDGFVGGTDFSVTSVCVVAVGGDTKQFDYTLISPTGQIVVVPTSVASVPAPVGSGFGYCLPVTVPSGRGVWTIEVRPKAAGAATSEYDWNGAMTVPYVGLSGSPAEVLLAVVFDGVPVTTTTTTTTTTTSTTTTPPPACHTISGTPPMVACSPGGNSPVQATFTVTISPAVPPYAGAVDWEVTDATTGVVVFDIPGGGPTETLTFPAAGDYDVTATIVRLGCSPLAKVWTRNITVLSCNCPTFSGTLNGAPSTSNSCAWNFWVAVNNPGNVPITYEWDFDVGSTPASTAITNGPSASVTYANSGTKTVRVRLKAGACVDELTTTIVVDCGGTTTTTTTPGPTTTTTTTTAPTTTTTTTPTTPPGGGGGIGCLCALLLIPAMILTAIAGVSFVLWGCTLFNPVLLLTAAGSGLAAIALFMLWIILCRDCPSITFLSRFFLAMAVLMLIVAALLMLFGQFGCARGAAAVAILFFAIAATLGLGGRALRCP